MDIDNRGIEAAVRRLKRLVAVEGILKTVKSKRGYEKPSVKKRRKRREAERRRRRAVRRMSHRTQRGSTK